MIPAKKFGGKVTQYFIGFGPTVWSKQVGETEYGVKAIPLGGYVKIVGMLPPEAEELADSRTAIDEQGRQTFRVRKSNTGMFTQLISDARAAEWELVGPEDSDRLFYKMPWWKKVIVMAGGPTVNILIAFFIFWGVFATYGQKSEEPVPGAPVDRHRLQVRAPLHRGGARLHCRRTRCLPLPRPGSARATRSRASTASAITGWDQLRDLIRDNADGAGGDRLRARRAAADRHHQHHRRGPAQVRDRRDPAPGRLPRACPRPRRWSPRPAARSTRSTRWAT